MLEHARRRYTCLAATVECVTDSVSGEGNAIGRVRPSVRPFASSLFFEPTNL